MRGTYKSLGETTAEDWAPLQATWGPFVDGLASRVLSHLELMDYDFGAMPVTQLGHSLQTATRAFQAGRDEEYVVCALLHDLGDMLAPTNHGAFAATVLRPYISERNGWMLEKHPIFQGYYFFQHWGMDRDAREAFRGHPHFEYTAEFCALFDQSSFDAGFENMPLAAFRPMVERVLSGDRVAGGL